jgi:hypothetical protein
MTSPACGSHAYPHSLSSNTARYRAAMSDLILTPVLAAALAKPMRRRPLHKGGGGKQKSPHNYVAEGEKRRPGAPLGNRNAACRDAALLDRRARLRAVRSVVDDTCALARAIEAAVDEGMKARARLSALLLPGAQP